MDSQRLLECAMDVGEALLRSGAEIYRVEDSVGRILNAYGARRADVFAIPSVIIASLTMPGEGQITQTRRILSSETNLDALSQVNDLCRRVCAQRPEPEQIDAELKAILARKPYPWFVRWAAYALIAMAFAVFFGGGWPEGLAAGAVGALLFLAVEGMKKLGVGSVFPQLLGAAVLAALTLLAARLAPGLRTDKVVIGNIMLLIPGVELTNGMRDLFSGDVLAGLLHIGEAVFLATIVALGAVFILSLGGTV